MKWFHTHRLASKHFAMQEWIQCAMFTSQFIWKVNQPVNQLNQTEPNKNKNKTPNETCANTSIRTHIRGTNLIEMESAKLKIKIISIGWACNCECEKMRCQQLDVRTEWVSVVLCLCVFLCVSLYTLGDVAHINLFIYFLFTTFFSLVHSIFAASFRVRVCVRVWFAYILYAKRVHFNCPKIVWTLLACAWACVCVCVYFETMLMYPPYVCGWWCEAPLF